MWAAGLAVPPQEGILVCFNEDKRNGMIFFQVFQERGQFFQLRALAGVHQQRRACKIAFARRV